MSKKLTKIIAAWGFGLLSVFALSTSVSACSTGFYQPEEPKCLRNE